LNEDFISHKSPSAGFDFTSGKRIEQKLLDYNREAERFGGDSIFFFAHFSLYTEFDFISKLNYLQVMLMKSYRKYRRIIGFLLILCMIRIRTTSDCL
jgi:hypothetical protein